MVILLFSGVLVSGVCVCVRAVFLLLCPLYVYNPVGVLLLSFCVRACCIPCGRSLDFVGILCYRRSLFVTVFHYNECCTVFLPFVAKLYAVIMSVIYKCSVMRVLTFKVAAYVLLCDLLMVGSCAGILGW